MHGIILAELKKYVKTKLGDAAWEKLLTEAGYKGKVYLPIQEYPDAEVVQLVVTASKITGSPVPAILEDFGEFIVPDLIGMYGSLLDPSWRTLDVIEKTEKTIHNVVRIKNKGATPPELRTKRISPDEVLLDYGSARKMCSVAKGIGRGLATHFGERIEVSESACMANGAPSCNISFKRA